MTTRSKPPPISYKASASSSVPTAVT